MIMEMPMHDAYILVQGVHVIVVKMRAPISGHTDHLRLRTFDFSLRDCSTLLDKGGRARRANFYEGRRDFLLEGSRGVPSCGLNSLGSGAFHSLVSCCLSRRKRYAMVG